MSNRFAAQTARADKQDVSNHTDRALQARDTLDVPRVSDMRYIHLDNDVYQRTNPVDGTGVSDHDPPLITLKLAGTSTTGDVSGTVPATLSPAWRPGQNWR